MGTAGVPTGTALSSQKPGLEVVSGGQLIVDFKDQYTNDSLEQGEADSLLIV